MTYGLKILNPSGQFVLHSDAKGLYCLGKATLQGSVVQPSGSATGTTPGRVAGYSLYRISHPGDIVVAVDLPDGYYVGVDSITQPSSGVWEIKAFCGSSLDANNFIATQVQLDVWAYGLPQTNTPFNAYGLALYDSAGNLSWDLTRPNPLFVKGYVDDAHSAIPSLTRPVAIGPQATDITNDIATGPTINDYAVEHFRGALRRVGTSVGYAPVMVQRYRYTNAGEPLGLGNGDIYPTSSFIVEGSLLP
jgi:hypothetical protein